MLKPSAPQYEFIHSKKPLNLFHSGQGAGKTFTMGVISYLFVHHAPKIIGFIAANTYEQLSKSTLIEIYSVWKKEFNFIEDRDYVHGKKPPPDFNDNSVTLENYSNTISFRNGALIFVGSLDNYKAHDGKTLGWALLDETKDTKEEAVKDVILARLRQKGLFCNADADKRKFQFPYNDKGIGVAQNPLYIFTSPAKVQWLAEMFDLESQRTEILSTIFQPKHYYYNESGAKSVVISSAYHNAENLPPGYIENRIEILTSEKVEMNIFGSPFGKAGNEYYNAFEHKHNVRPVILNPDYPLHISFDFNVNPYMPATVWQIIPGSITSDGRMKVRCIREYALVSPRNSIEDVCSQFRTDYGPHLKQGMFFYGDATGKNKVPIKEVRSYFDVVRKGLIGLIGPSSERLLSQNPRHNAIGKQTLGRRDFMNACLKGAYGFDIEIDPSCKHLIADMQFMKEDENGAKLKEKEVINGVRCEKYGHMSDTMDAKICFVFERHWR